MEAEYVTICHLKEDYVGQPSDDTEDFARLSKLYRAHTYLETEAILRKLSIHLSTLRSRFVITLMAKT